jgi:hypothetical protein
MRDAMTRETIRDAVKSFQLPIYYHFVSQDYKDSALNAALYLIQTPEKLECLIKKSDADQPEKVMGFCIDALKFIIDELLSPQVDFQSDDTQEACRYCPFTALCR